MRNWKEVKRELLKNKVMAREYEKLKPRYALISQLIEARLRRGITQKELARRLGTKQSAIARVESGNANPTVEFLERVAFALRSKLIVQIK
ncbi:MAG: helix-turn-helix transcriptional regulator [bacterium]|nr:helix-turn-helix transcriptional regulator [bacterium]